MKNKDWVIWAIWLILAIWVGGVLIAVAYAQPPENADPALAPWYQGLKQPPNGSPCCSISDCRPVEARTIGNHYEILIQRPTFDVKSPTWVAVPDDRILQRTFNPVGRPVACWRRDLGVLCFVRGTET